MPLTYTAVGLPSGLTINSTTGLISGTIYAGDATNGPYAATVTASDGTYSSSVTFNWNVTHTDATALTMTNPGTQTNVAGDSVNVQVNASDPDGKDTLTYSAMGLPDGLDIDPFSGIISGTMADDAVSNTPYAVTVTADDGNGQTISQTFNWLVNTPALTATASPVSAVEGNDTGPITVATFTTPDLNSQASDFTASINWGDGNTDVGTVSGSNGSFTVTDAHTYAEKGSYPVSVTILDTVTGGSTTATNMATVSDAALNLTGGFQLGDPLSNPPTTFTVASFTDDNPNAPSSDYSVTINWGDGNQTSGNYLQNEGNCVYLIAAPHSYTLPSGQVGPLTYTVTVTLTDTDGASASTTCTIVVGNIQAGTSATMSNWIFQDQNSYAKASDFVAESQSGVALINWGDGTSSLGTVTGGPGNGSSPVPFSVQGTHTYTQDSYDQPNGQYQITVTLTDTDGSALTGTQYVSVVRPTMAGNGDEVEGQPGVAFNNVQVAEFTVPDATDGVSEFSATINWGDGSAPGIGTIQEVAPGLFEVLGSHTYTAAGSYSIQVEVSQDWQNRDPAMLFEGKEYNVNVADPEIAGPSYVPGNSIYLYTVALDRATANATEPHFTVDNAVATIARERKVLATVNGKEMCIGFSVIIQFKNQPAVVHIGMNNTKVDGLPFRYETKWVYVVQVNVKAPAFPLKSFYNESPSVVAAGPAKQVGVNIDGKVNAGFVKVLGGTWPILVESQVALSWAAKIVLKSTNPNAYSHIIVGFVQHATSERYRITYVGGKTLKEVGMEPGETYLDVNKQGDGPYYIDAEDAKRSGSKDPFEIMSEDSPFIYVPTKYQGAWAQQLSFLKTFTLDIVAASNTSLGLYGVLHPLFREATADWSFQAVGTFKQDDKNPSDVNFTSATVGPANDPQPISKTYPPNPVEWKTTDLPILVEDTSTPTANQADDPIKYKSGG